MLAPQTSAQKLYLVEMLRSCFERRIFYECLLLPAAFSIKDLTLKKFEN